jgi:cysteine desulfurase
MRAVYLDNNATTRCDPQAVAEMLPYLTEQYGNPSSPHGFGDAARNAIREARARVGALIGATAPEEIVFTSGGTESDNLAILAALKANPDRNEIIVSAVEHPAVLALVRRLEAEGRVKVHAVPLMPCGCLDRERYRAALSPRVALVSIMWANNETGVLFPVEALAEEAKAFGALVHVDAVQAAGRTPIDMKRNVIDLMSLSSHKMHGPKGVGALFVRRGLKVAPMILGGKQERARRGGTENVPGIVGFGKAAEIASARLRGDAARMQALRDRFERGAAARIPGAVIVGGATLRLPNTSLVSCPGVEAEAIAALMAREGVAVSTGAACAAGAAAPSHVLTAIGSPQLAKDGAVRVSLSRESDDDDIDRALDVMAAAVARLRPRPAAVAAREAA